MLVPYSPEEVAQGAWPQLFPPLENGNGEKKEVKEKTNKAVKENERAVFPHVSATDLSRQPLQGVADIGESGNDPDDALLGQLGKVCYNHRQSPELPLQKSLSGEVIFATICTQPDETTSVLFSRGGFQSVEFTSSRSSLEPGFLSANGNWRSPVQVEAKEK